MRAVRHEMRSNERHIRLTVC